MDSIDELREKSFLVLQRIYELCSQWSQRVDLMLYGQTLIAVPLGLNSASFGVVLHHLAEEGFIDRASGSISITTRGVRELMRRAPEQSHAVQNIMMIHQAVQSNIQQGSQGSIQSVVLSNKEGREELQKLLSAIRQAMPQLQLESERQIELEADLQTLEAQTRSPHPKPSIVHECLLSVRNILEGAAGGALGVGLVQAVVKLLGG